MFFDGGANTSSRFVGESPLFFSEAFLCGTVLPFEIRSGVPP